jgi:hypothetical protein
MVAARRAGRVCARARVVGVAFFDYKHGQTGVAPNGIELHPFSVLPACQRSGHLRRRHSDRLARVDVD